MSHISRNRLVALLVGSCCVLIPPTSVGAWLPDGTPVCTFPPCSGYSPSVISDGAGGAFFAWNDNRTLTEVENVFLVHLNASGDLTPGWPVGGLQAARGDLVGHRLALDGQGGVFVCWGDFPARDIYLQRFGTSGLISPGWPSDGLLVCGAAQVQTSLLILSDGTGGAFVVWEDWRAGDYEKDIYASRILPDGTLAPGWPVDGLAICSAPYDQMLPRVAEDGAGGFYASWIDGRAVPWDVYMVRIHGDGTIAPGWQPNGTLIWAGPVYESSEALVPDGAGGVYVTWSEWPPDGSEQDLFVQRVDGDGALHAGWPKRGVPVCTAPDLQGASRSVADGLGGIVIGWVDQRDGSGGSDAYALRVLGDGSRAPGWPENGLIVGGGPGFQSNRALAADGAGGAYFAYERTGTPSKIFIQHLTGNGSVAPGWVENGYSVTPGLASGHTDPSIAADGRGGAIVVWEDKRRVGYDDVYAQKFVTDGPTPVLISLANVVAEHDRVAIVWYGAEGAIAEATIYRRREDGGWEELGRATFDGSGRLEFEDRGIASGERYAYRLGWIEGGRERFSLETWVDVPKAFSLALEGACPNPAFGQMNVAFTLANTERAMLQLLDVSGRAVLTLEVGSQGAGRHFLPLNEASRVPPGLYWLRLTQSGHSLVSRVAKIR